MIPPRMEKAIAVVISATQLAVKRRPACGSLFMVGILSSGSPRITRIAAFVLDRIPSGDCRAKRLFSVTLVGVKVVDEAIVFALLRDLRPIVAIAAAIALRSPFVDQIAIGQAAMRKIGDM